MSAAMTPDPAPVQTPTISDEENEWMNAPMGHPDPDALPTLRYVVYGKGPERHVRIGDTPWMICGILALCTEKLRDTDEPLLAVCRECANRTLEKPMTDSAAPVGLPKETTHFPGDDCDPPHLDMSTVAAPVGLDLDRIRRVNETNTVASVAEVRDLLDLVSRLQDALRDAPVGKGHQSQCSVWRGAGYCDCILKTWGESVRSLLPREPQE